MSSPLRLSELLGRPVATTDGQAVGRVGDAVVRLARPHPPVVGFTVSVGGRTIFVPSGEVAGVNADGILLTTSKLDLRVFERREGEVLVRADILGHRLIDVAAARLTRARDGEIVQEGSSWVLSCLDTSAGAGIGRAWMIRTRRGECRDWAEFEPLIGHLPSARTRASFSRLRRLRPSEIADLVENASSGETDEILDALHEDPEFEADVFEEMEPDQQVEILQHRDDREIAELLGHMRPDDAADLLADLPQDRRLPLLDLLPASVQRKIRVLLGYNAASAGGLMTPDVLALSARTTAAAALAAVRQSTTIGDEGLMAVYAVDDDGRLVGTISLPALVKAQPETPLDLLADSEPVSVSPSADITEVAIRMADFNMVSIPVVDAENRLLGVITVDDVLETTVPDDWRRRKEGVSDSDRSHRSQPPTPPIAP